MKFGEKLSQRQLLSRLSHKVCRLSSPVLLRTQVRATQEAGSRLSGSVGGAEKRTFTLFHPLCITYCPLLSECLGLAKSRRLEFRRSLNSARPEKSNTSWKVRVSDRLKLRFRTKVRTWLFRSYVSGPVPGDRIVECASLLFFFSCSHHFALFLRS